MRTGDQGIEVPACDFHDNRLPARLRLEERRFAHEVAVVLDHHTARHCEAEGPFPDAVEVAVADDSAFHHVDVVVEPAVGRERLFGLQPDLGLGPEQLLHQFVRQPVGNLLGEQSFQCFHCRGFVKTEGALSLSPLCLRLECFPFTDRESSFIS